MGAEYISVGLMGMGMLTNAYGQAQQAQLYQQSGAWSQRQSYIQAAIMDYNATIAERDAQSYAQIGAANRAAYLTEAAAVEGNALDRARTIRREASRHTGTQVTTYLKNGVTLAGTPALVIMEDQELAEQDIANVLENGRREATRYELQASMAMLEGLTLQRKTMTTAALDRIMANETRLAGDYAYESGIQRSNAAYIGLGASLLSGAGSMAMRYGTNSATGSGSLGNFGNSTAVTGSLLS